jgi:hypothetical protein
MIEEHRFLLNWPGEVEAFKNSILFGDTVLQRALVESERREVAEAGMHTILYLKSDGSDS